MSVRAYKSLSAATGTGVGSAKGGARTWAMDVIVTGAPSAVTVLLEGSVDGGATWRTLTTMNTAAGARVEAPDKPATKIRANLTVLTGGTTPTVTAWIVGVD